MRVSVFNSVNHSGWNSKGHFIKWWDKRGNHSMIRSNDCVHKISRWLDIRHNIRRSILFYCPPRNEEVFLFLFSDSRCQYKFHTSNFVPESKPHSNWCYQKDFNCAASVHCASLAWKLLFSSTTKNLPLLAQYSFKMWGILI